MQRRALVKYLGIGALTAGAFATGILARRYYAEPTASLTDSPPATLSAFRFEDVDGVERASEEWAGQHLLINFWATWCAPCREEIPLLVTMQDAYREQGLQVIGLALDFAEPTRRFGDELGINYPSLVPGRDQGFAILERYQPQALLPFSMLVNPKLEIVSRKLGAYEPGELRDAVEKLLTT